MPEVLGPEKLSRADYDRLNEILANQLPVNADQRRTWLRSALIDLPSGSRIVNNVPNWDAQPRGFADSLIIKAMTEGHRWPDKRSLLSFLIRRAAEDVDVETQDFLGGLFLRYQLEKPTEILALPDTYWRGLQAMVGTGRMQPVAYLQEAAAAANAVVYITFGASGGTGFLVAPNTIMTCGHVITPDKVSLSRTFAHFFFQAGPGGEIETPVSLRINPNGPFAYEFNIDSGLDYCVFTVEEHERTKAIVPLKLDTRSVELGTEVSIIQHPLQQLKRICQRDNLIDYVDDEIVQYTTNTEKGSSGGPVLTDWTDVVAVHCRSAEKIGAEGKNILRNEGSRISRIVPHIASKYPKIRDMLEVLP